jgi:hypothetical protein
MAWAETYVKKAPDCQWLLGNYIQASTEQAQNYNSNGHSWPFDDALKAAIANLPLRPLNLLHAPNRRIGAIAAAEFVYPEGNGATASDEAPIVEILSCLWSHYEPDLMPAIQMAHKEGTLAFSMECIPQTLTCKGKGEYAGCGETFTYKGRTDPSYCEHLNLPLARKQLNNSMFTASALILPPSRPGWVNASVKEISRLVEDNLAEAEAAYNEIAAAVPHLESIDHEKLMQWFLMATEGDR